jgi:glycosyltransferase involved in cell wall biosynthesis
MTRIRLSGAMTARNDAATIGPVLDRLVPLCDEILLVDGGSEDDTVRIAERKPRVRIYHRDLDDHGRQRNFAVDQCLGDWILSLDADETIAGPRVGWLRGLTRIPGVRWVSVRRRWLVRREGGEVGTLDSGPWEPDCVTRLYRNLPEFREEPGAGARERRFRGRRGLGVPLAGPCILAHRLLPDRADRERRAAEDPREHLLWEDASPSISTLPARLAGGVVGQLRGSGA